MFILVHIFVIKLHAQFLPRNIVLFGAFCKTQPKGDFLWQLILGLMDLVVSAV